MALVSVIRRWHLRDGMPIREIARRTGLSRNTVRKYLASQELDVTIADDLQARRGVQVERRAVREHHAASFVVTCLEEVPCRGEHRLGALGPGAWREAAWARRAGGAGDDGGGTGVGSRRSGCGCGWWSGGGCAP